MQLSSKASDMGEILEAVTELVLQLSPEKVAVLATRIRGTDVSKAAVTLPKVVMTPLAGAAVKRLSVAWQNSGLEANEVASMLQAASHTSEKLSSAQSIDLVLTGPTTPFVSSRRTEQALLQVINSAEHSLFVTSFVAYDVSSVIKAMNEAAGRGVSISMLLELSQDQGGSVNFDAVSKMKGLVPSVKVYVWRDKGDEFAGGRVHAKVAVADSKLCFITSANLTGFAMERNMEAGVLIKGNTAKLLREHLDALVVAKVIHDSSLL